MGLPGKRIGSDRDEAMFSVVEGPLCVVRACRCCNFAITTRKALPGRRTVIGRGNGFVVGNKARGDMIQHFKQQHPDAYAKAKDL